MKERRAFPRVKISRSVLYSKDIYPRLTVDTTLNLSMGESKIESYHSLTKGDGLDLTIGIDPEAIKCRGKVIYVLQPETGKTQAGIQLQELSEHDKHHLRQYLFSIMEEEAVSSLSPEKTLH